MILERYDDDADLDIDYNIGLNAYFNMSELNHGHANEHDHSSKENKI